MLAVALAMLVWLCRERRRFKRFGDGQLEEAKPSLDIIPEIKAKRNGRRGVPSFISSRPSKGFRIPTSSSSPPPPPPSKSGIRSSMQRLKPLILREKRFTEASGALQHDGDSVRRYTNIKKPLYVDPKISLVSPTTPGDFVMVDGNVFRLSPSRSNPMTASTIPIPINTPLPMNDGGSNSFSTSSSKPPQLDVTLAPTDTGVPAPISNTFKSARRQSVRSHPTSISSDVINQILEMATMYSPSAGGFSLSMSPGDVDPDSSPSHRRPSSATELGIAASRAGAIDKTRTSELVLNGGSLLQLPTSPFSPSPSNVKDSEGKVITAAYLSSNWVDASSLSPNRSGPPTGSSTLLTPSGSLSQRLVTPSTSTGTYREPPLAAIPTSPLPSPFSGTGKIEGNPVIGGDGDSDVMGKMEQFIETSKESQRKVVVPLDRPPASKRTALS